MRCVASSSAEIQWTSERHPGAPSATLPARTAKKRSAAPSDGRSASYRRVGWPRSSSKRCESSQRSKMAAASASGASGSASSQTLYAPSAAL